MSATIQQTNGAESPVMLSYGEKFQVPLDAVPQSTIRALLSRGVTHYMGSEMASKVVQDRKDAVAAEAKLAAEEGREPRPSIEVFTDEEAEEAKAEYQADAWDRLLAGTMGEGSRGPRGTAVETVMRRIIVAHIATTLKAAGITMPKNATELVVLGSESYTLPQLIARQIAADGDRFREEAEAEMRALARKAAKAIEDAKASGATGASAFGL